MLRTFVEDDDGVRKLDITFESSDTQSLLSFFPITMALWRGGYKVLYAGYEPRLRKRIGITDGMTDSYIVTECRESGEKECWLLPPIGETWLKAFLTKEEYEVKILNVFLWQVPWKPEDFPTVQYANHLGNSVKDIVAEKKVLPFSQEVDSLKASLEEQKKDIHDFRCRTAEDKLVIKSLQGRIHELDQNLDAAEVMSCDNFDLLQKERKKAHDRANVIIDMTTVAEERRALNQKFVATNKWQAEKIRGLLDQMNVKTQSNAILHEANTRLKKSLDESRKGARPRYEVEAHRDVSLSSFKMTTVATAIRWMCAASMSGSLAYMLV